MKYAVVFSLLAATLLFNAWLVDRWLAAIPLAWASISCGLVAIAYWFNAPGIFGKRPDGRLGVLNAIVLFPYRVLAQAVWWFNIRLSAEPAWHRIDDRLIVGRRLLGHEVPPGVDAVLDLTCEFSEPRRLRSLAYRCLPMLDASTPSMERLLAAVQESAALPGTLYIHCAQGHGRTGLVAALVMAARTLDLAPEAALARLQQIRPGIGLNRRQHALLTQMGSESAQRRHENNRGAGPGSPAT